MNIKLLPLILAGLTVFVADAAQAGPNASSAKVERRVYPRSRSQVRKIVVRRPNRTVIHHSRVGRKPVRTVVVKEPYRAGERIRGPGRTVVVKKPNRTVVRKPGRKIVIRKPHRTVIVKKPHRRG